MDSRTAAAMYQLRKAIEALPANAGSDKVYDKFSHAVDAIVAAEAARDAK